MIGKSFQPGSNQDDGRNGNGPSRAGGIQEAIKILSLRLPKVLGAQAAAPMALLTSPGGGGNRVDSVVNQVMQRMGPQGAPPSGAPSGMGASAPNFGPEMMGGSTPPMMPNWPMPPQTSAFGKPRFNYRQDPPNLQPPPGPDPRVQPPQQQGPPPPQTPHFDVREGPPPVSLEEQLRRALRGTAGTLGPEPDPTASRYAF